MIGNIDPRLAPFDKMGPPSCHSIIHEVSNQNTYCVLHAAHTREKVLQSQPNLSLVLHWRRQQDSSYKSVVFTTQGVT